MVEIEWISCPWFWARGLQESFNILYIQITLKFIHTFSATLFDFSYIFANTFDIILDDKKASQTHQVHNHA